MKAHDPIPETSKAASAGIPAGLTPAFILGMAVLLGGGLRVAIVLSADFPFNDGGLFNTITQEIVRGGFRLPPQTSYNQMNIPFVYPPLAFYMAGVLHSVSGISIVEIQRWLPLFFSLLTIPAFWLLSQTVLKRPGVAALATLAFALLPNSTDRLLMGGGLTRAPGFFFALLALNCIWRAFEEGSWKNTSSAILFSTLTALTHPVYTAFTIYSAGVFFLFLPGKKHNLPRALVIGAGVLLISAPWWIGVLHTHGFAPLWGAFQSRNALPLIVRVSQLLFFDLSGELFLEIIGVFSLLGLIFTLFERDYLFFGWLMAIFLCERTSPVALAVVPLAILAGIGAGKIFAAGEAVWGTASRRWFVMISFSLVVYYSLVASYIRYDAPVLTPGVRQGMAWASSHTPAGSRYLILTSYPWWDDPASEWFPTLSGQISVTTVQGYEWTSPYLFALRGQAYEAAQNCLQTIQTSCLEQWSTEYNTPYDYIFIPKMGAPKGKTAVMDTPLVQSLVAARDDQILYDGSGALILKKP